MTISIHAPARGATETNNKLIKQATEFQSTLPQGERLILYIIFFRCLIISIHAPARGATPSEKVYLEPSEFQSTLPQGERLVSSA